MTDLTSKELQAIEYISALEERLKQSEKHIEGRLKTIPDAWRQFRMARAAIGRVTTGLYDTIPPRSLVHLQKLAMYGEVVVRIKPASKPVGVKLVPEDILAMLVNTAVASVCGICLNDTREVKTCKLRKDLTVILPTELVYSGGSCPYRDLYAHNEDGE